MDDFDEGHDTTGFNSASNSRWENIFADEDDEKQADLQEQEVIDKKEKIETETETNKQTSKQATSKQANKTHKLTTNCTDTNINKTNHKQTLYSQRDSVILLIDCESAMFEENDKGEIPFQASIKNAILVLTDKIISNDSDLIGVCFYGTVMKRMRKKEKGIQER